MFIAFGSLVVLGSVTVLAYATKIYFQSGGGGNSNETANRFQESFS